jgi:hypothetical protein
MLNKILIRKSITLMTVVAVWCVFSMPMFAAPGDVMGEISIKDKLPSTDRRNLYSTITSEVQSLRN